MKCLGIAGREVRWFDVIERRVNDFGAEKRDQLRELFERGQIRGQLYRCDGRKQLYEQRNRWRLFNGNVDFAAKRLQQLVGCFRCDFHVAAELLERT